MKTGMPQTLLKFLTIFVYLLIPLLAHADSETETKPQQQTASQARSLPSPMTMTEENALRRQIYACWNVPAGIHNEPNLIVEINILVNPDRIIASAEVVDKSRMANDSSFRAIAESALRALNNPKCSPLELPADKYDQWKKTILTFDPRDML